MARKIYTAFVSHSWDYDQQLISLKNMLERNGSVNIDYSEVTVSDPINSENASYIKGKLKQRIISSDVFLIMAGMYTVYSDWMKWELDTAKKNNIPIVAVKPRGAERIPHIIQDNAEIIVNWNSNSITDSIINAIRGTLE
jgi:hypothetical protein